MVKVAQMTIPPEFETLLAKILAHFDQMIYPTWASRMFHTTRSAKARNLEKTYIPRVRAVWSTFTPSQKAIILPDLRQFCDTMKAEIKELDFKERQYTVRQLIDTVVTDGMTATVEGSIPLFIPEDKNQNNYGQSFINRYCRTSKRGKKYAF